MQKSSPGERPMVYVQLFSPQIDSVASFRSSELSNMQWLFSCLNAAALSPVTAYCIYTAPREITHVNEALQLAKLHLLARVRVANMLCV